MIEQRQQPRIVPGLTRRQNDRHREASPVDGQVDLAGQSAAGPSEGFSFNGEVLDPRPCGVPQCCTLVADQ
jgi:hypothetical protein